jgi:hypothetical protein
MINRFHLEGQLLYFVMLCTLWEIAGCLPPSPIFQRPLHPRKKQPHITNLQARTLHYFPRMPALRKLHWFPRQKELQLVPLTRESQILDIERRPHRQYMLSWDETAIIIPNMIQIVQVQQPNNA